MTSSVVCVNGSLPRLHVVEPGRALESFGDLAGGFSAAYGLIPDEWQQLILDDWLGVDEFGLWASLTCGLACPRQNGKNAILEVRELFGMVGRGEKILHTAHEVKTARKAFKRLQHFFGREVHDPAAKFPELNDRVIELRNVNGQEAIFLDNGGSVEIVARSKNSGRGFTADVLVMDEAQEMSDEDIEALMPTTSAAPLGNPQWIFTGTPPGPKANGEVFTRTRLDALSESPYRICWHEWSACDPEHRGDIDPDDRDLWHATNPALGGRLQLAVVEGERSRFSLEGFLRERLGVWDVEATASLALPRWASCLDERSGPVGDVAFGLDASPNLTSGTIVVAGHSGLGGTHIEITSDEDETYDCRPGTDWMTARAKTLQKRWRGAFAVAKGSPAAALVKRLTDAGVTVVEVSIEDHRRACGDFESAVAGGQLWHHGQPDMDAAVRAAVQKAHGDAWLWDRRHSNADISPIVAAGLAKWALEHTTVPNPGFVDLSDFDEG